MRALVLLTLLAIAIASCGQSASDPLRVVCFTVDEAREIGDTLWSRLDDREKRRLALVIMQSLDANNRSHERENAALKAQIAPLVEAAAGAREDARLAKDDALGWQMKARGRGGRGFVVGIGVGALATFGAYKAGQGLGLIR